VGTIAALHEKVDHLLGQVGETRADIKALYNNGLNDARRIMAVLVTRVDAAEEEIQDLKSRNAKTDDEQKGEAKATKRLTGVALKVMLVVMGYFLAAGGPAVEAFISKILKVVIP